MLARRQVTPPIGVLYFFVVVNSLTKILSDWLAKLLVATKYTYNKPKYCVIGITTM